MGTMNRTNFGDPPPSPGRKKRHQTTVRRFAIGLTVTTFLLLGASIHKAFELMGHHDTHIARNVENHPAMAVRAVGTEPLDHESMFVDTLKSCLPNEGEKNCNTYVPGDGTTERVGILAPPGSTTKTLLKLVNFLTKHGRTGPDGKVIQLQVIPTTHIPPYGYGKTHGWTRLIRVVPQPLLVGATDTLRWSVMVENQTMVSFNDVKAALRQQIRYHCRLNHISAHTAIWTVGLEDISAMPLSDLIESVQDFLVLEGAENDIDKVTTYYKTTTDDDNTLSQLDAMYAKGASLLSLLQTQVQGNVLKILDEVLLDEMKISNNLTAWPCQSFWTVGEAEDRSTISPIIRRIAKAMSPNCDAQFTSCFVNRDKCEFNGDGVCESS